MWVRGLKHRAELEVDEISMSHPMWVRGLKLVVVRRSYYCPLSHPMWVRGLKHVLLQVSLKILRVAPHVGAWIETHRFDL